MASIDKIYGTQEQYLELKKWLLENQKPIKSLVEVAQLFQNLEQGQSVMLKIKRKNGYAYVSFGIK